MLQFSPANRKIRKLAEIDSIRPYLQGRRKIYSLDLLAGRTCPFAKTCRSHVVETEQGRRIIDGKHTVTRCYAASLEAIFPDTYNLHKRNTEAIRSAKTFLDKFSLIEESLPKNLGVCRIHSSGDMFDPDYFDAWLHIAIDNPDRLFYLYTKDIPSLIRQKRVIEAMPNFIITASFGGIHDDLIIPSGLRYARIVDDAGHASEYSLELDDDDSHAARPDIRHVNFALAEHGVQPAGRTSLRSLEIGKV